MAGMAAAGLDEAKVEALFARAGREVADGNIGGCQVAIARGGRVFARCYGTAAYRGEYDAYGRLVREGVRRAVRPTDVFHIFSATKAVLGVAVLQLLESGHLSLDDPVCRHIPGFEANGKGSVTVKHVLTHTAGFPHPSQARRRTTDSLPRIIDPELFDNSAARTAEMASWHLEKAWTDPKPDGSGATVSGAGTAFEYHELSAHYVLSELVERILAARGTPMSWKEYCRRGVLAPAGLVPGGELAFHLGDYAGTDAADCVHGPLVVRDYGGVLPDAHPEVPGSDGVYRVEEQHLAPRAREQPGRLKQINNALDKQQRGIHVWNHPDALRNCAGGGGALATAAAVAMLYQPLAEGGGGLLRPETLRLATRLHMDPTLHAYDVLGLRGPDGGQLRAVSQRGLNFQIALEGEEEVAGGRHVPRRVLAGFGHTNSSLAFGHGGAGGQVAWADPATGISFAFVTDTFTSLALQGKRGTALSTLAAGCAAAPGARL